MEDSHLGTESGACPLVCSRETSLVLRAGSLPPTYLPAGLPLPLHPKPPDSATCLFPTVCQTLDWGRSPLGLPHSSVQPG